MPFANNLFNKNQKVWVTYTTGAMACEVVGKYRGKHRYICGWVRWDTKCKQDKIPEFKNIEISKALYDKIMKIAKRENVGHG